MSVYVYSIVAASHPCRLTGLHGVGESPGALRTVDCGSLAAVVSDAPPDLRPKRRDLAAHQAVQERLMADGTVLPLRFGLTAEDDDAVRAAVQEGAADYTQRLGALEGCAEYHLKAAQSEGDLLRDILRDSAEASRLNEEIRSGRGTPDLSLALGELVAQEVRTRQEAQADEVAQALRSFARDERSSPATGDDFLNISFLVAAEDEENFVDAEKRLVEELGEGFDLRLRGPLPAYSFV